MRRRYCLVQIFHQAGKSYKQFLSFILLKSIVCSEEISQEDTEVENKESFTGNYHSVKAPKKICPGQLTSFLPGF